MGNRYLRAEQPDSALLCYNLVTGRYDLSMSHAQKRQCVDAYLATWTISFTFYNDYFQSYNCLFRIRQIDEDTGEHTPKASLFFGFMYQTISEQTNDSLLAQKAVDSYKEAFTSALPDDDREVIDAAVSNLVLMAYQAHRFEQADSVWNVYSELPDDGYWPRRYGLLLYEGLRLLEQGQSAAAFEKFRQQQTLLDLNAGTCRGYYVSSHWQALACLQARDYAGAIEVTRQVLPVTLRFGMKDAELETYQSLSDLYRQSGREDEARYYLMRYLQLKDSLLNYQQLMSVGRLEFIAQNRAMDEQMQLMNNQQRRQTTRLHFILVIALVVALSAVVLYYKNRQLRHRNNRLYLKTEEMLTTIESERRRREASVKAQRSYQAEIESLKAQLGATATVAADDGKYKHSSLAETDKEELITRILYILGHADEIYSPDFTLEHLSRLAGSNYKHVSQVINERLNKNFNQLLNDYRIYKACKCITDQQHYGHLTIEAIAQSVGFRSRTTFATAFKRITGLTPSEYQAAAREH